MEELFTARMREEPLGEHIDAFIRAMADRGIPTTPCVAPLG